MPARHFFSSICGPGHPAISPPSAAWACRRWPRGRGSPWRRSAGKHAALRRRPPALPLALRAAPAPIGRPENRGQLLDALVAPARSGVLLTREDLREAAAAAGLGYRVGERRYTLGAMLDQDAGAAVRWLADHARRWAVLHAAQQSIGGHDPRHWWARRAARTAHTLQQLQTLLVTGS